MPSALRSAGYKRATENYVIPVNDLHVQPGFNPRGIAYEDLEVADLVEFIRNNGVKPLPPLRVRMLDGKITIIAGHRRHKATSQLVAEGMDIAGLTCEMYTGISEADALALGISENMGEPVSSLNQAKSFQRLQNFNWDVATIAQKTGCSTVHVYNMLKILELGEESVKALEADIQAGEITSTDALQIAKEVAKGEGTPEEVTSKVKAAKAQKRAVRKQAAAIKDPVQKVSFKLEVQMKPLLDQHGVLPLLTIMVKYSSKEEILDYLATLEE